MMANDIRFEIGYVESGAGAVATAFLGRSIRILASCGRREVSVACAVNGLWDAIALKQIIFLYNSKGVAVAYATWMFLTDEVAEAIIAGERHESDLDIGEKNEGDVFWVVDIVAPFGDIYALIKKAYIDLDLYDRAIYGRRSRGSSLPARFIKARRIFTS